MEFSDVVIHVMFVLEPSPTEITYKAPAHVGTSSVMSKTRRADEAFATKLAPEWQLLVVCAGYVPL